MQLFGCIEKAVIVIEDDRSCATNANEMPAVSGQLQSAAGLGAGIGSLTRPESVTGAARMALNMESNQTALPKREVRMFVVQFNPASLHLSGHGGSVNCKVNYNNNSGADAIKQENMRTHITLDMKLIFDSVSALSEDSVQKKVEGFLAAVHSNYTRRIMFLWGDLCYSGVISEVSAQYMMFNAYGEPIRAEVSLCITCTDEEVSENNMGQWQQHYQSAFRNGNVSYTGAAQKVGNFLNLSL